MRQAIIFPTKWIFLVYLEITSINNQNMRVHNIYKNVLHDNGDKLALSKNMKPTVFVLKTDRVQKYIPLGKSWLHCEIFLHDDFLTQNIVTRFCWQNHWKAIVKTLLLVALRFDPEQNKFAHFHNKHNQVNFNIGQKQEENHFSGTKIFLHL